MRGRRIINVRCTGFAPVRRETGVLCLLLVADIVLPGQGGLDFMLERKSHENGGPRFLFTSGKINVAHASFRMIAEQFGDVRALQKPFTVEEFLAAVDGALSGPPQA